MNDDQLATILRSSYHTSSLQDYYQNHVFEVIDIHCFLLDWRVEFE